jgi:hypothetical protein
MLALVSCETLTIPTSTVLGVAEDVSEALIDRLKSGENSNEKSQVKPRRKRKNEALYEQV